MITVGEGSKIPSSSEIPQLDNGWLLLSVHQVRTSVAVNRWFLLGSLTLGRPVHGPAGC